MTLISSFRSVLSVFDWYFRRKLTHDTHQSSEITPPQPSHPYFYVLRPPPLAASVPGLSCTGRFGIHSVVLCFVSSYPERHEICLQIGLFCWIPQRLKSWKLLGSAVHSVQSRQRDKKIWPLVQPLPQLPDLRRWGTLKLQEELNVPSKSRGKQCRLKSYLAVLSCSRFTPKSIQQFTHPCLRTRVSLSAEESAARNLTWAPSMQSLSSTPWAIMLDSVAFNIYAWIFFLHIPLFISSKPIIRNVAS